MNADLAKIDGLLAEIERIAFIATRDTGQIISPHWLMFACQNTRKKLATAISAIQPEVDIDGRPEVEFAIQTIADRFPSWAPTPAMLGYARAVGKETLAQSPMQTALEGVLPFLEGPRLREEAQAAAGEISRMPIRSAIRKARAALSRPAPDAGEGGR